MSLDVWICLNASPLFLVFLLWTPRRRSKTTCSRFHQVRFLQSRVLQDNDHKSNAHLTVTLEILTPSGLRDMLWSAIGVKESCANPLTTCVTALLTELPQFSIHAIVSFPKKVADRDNEPSFKLRPGRRPDDVAVARIVINILLIWPWQQSSKLAGFPLNLWATYIDVTVRRHGFWRWVVKIVLWFLFLCKVCDLSLSYFS